MLIIIDLLKRGADVASYGYDVYIYSVIHAHLRAENPRRQQHEFAQEYLQLSSVFYAAAWELCRRGILRPGVKAANT